MCMSYPFRKSANSFTGCGNKNTEPPNIAIFGNRPCDFKSSTLAFVLSTSNVISSGSNAKNSISNPCTSPAVPECSFLP